MIIKRYNGQSQAFETLYPTTITTRLFDSTGATPIFDSNDKINLNFLPNAVFDSLYFFTTATNGNTLIRAAQAFNHTLTNDRSPIGYYFVASQSVLLTPGVSTATTVFSKTFVPTAGSNVLTAASGVNTDNISVGMTLLGVNIPGGTTVVSITSSTTLVMSEIATGGGSPVSVSFQRFFQTSISFGEEINVFERSFAFTSGSSVFTGDTTQLRVGMNVTGTGIETGAKIQTINSSTSFTLSSTATANGPQTLTFQFGTSPASVQLETGDWFVITDFTGLGTSASPFLVTFGVINNTYEIMSGAGATTAGAPGLVPGPAAGQNLHFLRGDGTFVIPTNTEYVGSDSITLESGNAFQRAALTGDVTAAANSNSTTIANDAVKTDKIIDDAVNFAKFQKSAAAGLSVIGRTGAGSANFAEITGADGQVLRRSGTTLGFGTIVSAGIADNAITAAKIDANAVETAKIKDGAVSFSKLPQSSANTSIIGRNVNNAGIYAEIVAIDPNLVLRSADQGGGIISLDFGQVNGGGIADGAISNAKLANTTGFTLKGKSTAGNGAVSNLTPLAVRTMSNLAPILFGPTLLDQDDNSPLNTPIAKSNGMVDGSAIPTGTIWYDTTTA